jgi:hypothetical protein
MTGREKIDIIRATIVEFETKDTLQAVFEFLLEDSSANEFMANEWAIDEIGRLVREISRDNLKYNFRTTHLDVHNQKHLDLLNPQMREEA